MAIPQARNQPVNLLLVSIVFPYPHPEASVEVPSTLVVLRFRRCLVGEVQIIVGHLKERLPIGFFIRRPHIIGVVVWCDVYPLLLCSGACRSKQG